MSTAAEVNFDGLVGPTHNYAGLSPGNRASQAHGGQVSNPRGAARQGLAKMRRLVDLGVPQAVLPPHQRPDPTALARLGLRPGDRLDRLPDGLGAALLSASPMWAANAATVTPSVDAADGRVHLTPANLVTTFHRSLESIQTTTALRAIFADPGHFVVHDPLPAHADLADEGAANHGRVTGRHGQPGTHVFVYGRLATEPAVSGDRYPRRQTRLAGEVIAASHGLDPARAVFVRQAPAAIDAGAFHNDVVAVVNESVVFHHEDAFAPGPDGLGALEGVPAATRVEVARDRVPLADAISSYLFNSQLVTLPDASMVLIAPTEVEATPSTAAYVADAVADPKVPIDAVHYLDLRQSMSNGGGPACLRLRVVLTEAEVGALAGRVLLDHDRIDVLDEWVDRHYRDELAPADLFDPDLVDESNAALDELTTLLGLGSLYPFQRC